MEQEIKQLATAFDTALGGIRDVKFLTAIERDFLGKKGSMRVLRSRLGRLDPDQRRILGAQVEALLSDAENKLAARRAELEDEAWSARMDAEWIDVTIPSGRPTTGALHPITRLENRCIEILQTMGFELEDGPEVENAFFNFDALNVPKDHPARDLQDTFWLENGLLMRSHTTPVQARVLQEQRPVPLRILARGRVYRNEAVDATHLAMFHQLEGFWVDRGATLTQLQHVLGVLIRGVYGDRAYRFKPKYYPYTEPSIGLDIACGVCRGGGCPSCHGVGWVTVIGAGMIHPAVLRGFGYDPQEYSGFAFGWGTTRLAYQWLGLEKVKDLYSVTVEDLAFYAAVATNARSIT